MLVVIGNAILNEPEAQFCGQVAQYPPCGVVLVKVLFSGLSIDGLNNAVISIVTAIPVALPASSTMPASARNTELLIVFLLNRLPGMSLC